MGLVPRDGRHPQGERCRFQGGVHQVSLGERLGASRDRLHVKASLLQRLVHGCGVLSQHAHLGASRCNLNVKASLL